MDKKQPKVLPFQQKSVAKSSGNASKVDISASSSLLKSGLGEDALRVAIQRILHYGRIREMKHSAQDRSFRNVSQEDIAAMLDGPWKLVAKPDWDDEHHSWEYKLKGIDIEGDDLTLKIAVNEEMQRIDVITKF